MRKIIIVLLLCSVAAFVWRSHDRNESRLVFDRLWIDHMPNGAKDKFNTLVLAHDPSIGVRGAQIAWAGQWEAFRFDVRDGGKLEIVYPATGERETVNARARRCNENGFDYCLELTGSSRGARRYFSKREWDKTGMKDPIAESTLRQPL